MAPEFDRVAIQLLRLGPVAERDFDQRQMPAQVTVEKSVARIVGKPGQQKGSRRVRLAALVGDMDKTVCTVGVFGFNATDRSIFGRASVSRPSSESAIAW